MIKSQFGVIRFFPQKERYLEGIQNTVIRKYLIYIILLSAVPDSFSVYVYQQHISLKHFWHKTLKASDTTNFCCNKPLFL